MNINNLQVQLQTAVENAATEASADNTSATLYYLQLAKAVQALNMGQIRTVANIASLPTASTHEGWLFFVQADELLYFSNGTVWDGVVPIVRTVWAWGYNGVGQIGDNTTTSRSSPVSVVGGFCDWCQVSGGRVHSIGLRTNGTAWGWGCNGTGRLGDNTITNRSSPVSVVGGFTNWCQISAGSLSCHSLGVTQAGIAWAWGLNDRGQLGDNSAVTSRSSPVSVAGGFSDWCQVSAGGRMSLALRTGGTLWAWGYNQGGQLGDNTTTTRSSPVTVVGGFCDWCQISAGSTFSLAIRQNGTAWGWGCNNFAQLGTNNTTNRASPVSVVGGFTDWCQVSAGCRHSLGVRQNGTLWGWGANIAGQLGDDTSTDTSSPVSVIGGFTDWCQASAGVYHSLGLRQNSTLWGWGCNGQGRLGDNTNTNRSSPVSVVGGFCDWFQVSAGGCQTLAIRSTL